MHFDRHIKGSVLPMVIVISALMLLMVFGMLSYSEMSSLITERAVFVKNCRADIESAFVLYENFPETDGEFILYDSIPASMVTISKKTWGLYEAVSVLHKAGRIHKVNFCGLRTVPRSKTFYYADDGGVLTITGNTNITGYISIPSAGVVYGRSGATFFSGETIEQNRTSVSDKKLPSPDSDALRVIKTLFVGDYSTAEYLKNNDSINIGFYDTDSLLIVHEGDLNAELSGNIVVKGDKINLSDNSSVSDIIIVGKKVTVGTGFKGRVQIFASDTIIIEKNVTLEYPSGIYSGEYAELQDGSMVNGYVIVNCEENMDITKPNYKQSRLSKVRGLLYVKGKSLLQGIVSGTAYVEKAVYYSPQGYYKGMLLDFTILENEHTALPLWLDDKGKRKRMLWLN